MFKEYVEQCLAPTLKEGDIAISNKRPKVRRVKTASFKNLNVYLLAFLC
jgi:hypothetical protein